MERGRRTGKEIGESFKTLVETGIKNKRRLILGQRQVVVYGSSARFKIKNLFAEWRKIMCSNLKNIRFLPCLV